MNPNNVLFTSQMDKKLEVKFLFVFFFCVCLRVSIRRVYLLRFENVEIFHHYAVILFLLIFILVFYPELAARRN